jgi:hypothetical protein
MQKKIIIADSYLNSTGLSHLPQPHPSHKDINDEDVVVIQEDYLATGDYIDRPITRQFRKGDVLKVVKSRNAVAGYPTMTYAVSIISNGIEQRLETNGYDIRVVPVRKATASERLVNSTIQAIPPTTPAVNIEKPAPAVVIEQQSQTQPKTDNNLQNLADDKLSGFVNTSKNIQLYSIVGSVVGLGFAYTKKTGVWGYVGYATLFGIIGGVVGFALRGKSNDVDMNENKFRKDRYGMPRPVFVNMR